MKTILILTMLASIALADEVPTDVKTTESVAFENKFGSMEMPVGTSVKVLTVNSNATLTVIYNGVTNAIPAAKTDFDKQVQGIRFHNIVVDGFHYEDCKFEVLNVTDVKIRHRTGVATIKLAKLDDEHQKALGYDPKKAAEVEEAKRKAAAEAAETKRKAASTETWILTVEQILPSGILAIGHRQRDMVIVRRLPEVVVEGSVEAYQDQFIPKMQKPNPPRFSSDPLELFIVGHPKMNELAEGNKISVDAYKDGVITVDGHTLEKWIYYEAPLPKK